MIRTISSLLVLTLLAGIALAGEESPAAARLDEGWGLFRAHRYADAAKVFDDAAAAAEESGETTLRVRALSLAARSFLAADERKTAEERLAAAAALAKPDDPEAWNAYVAVRGRFEWKAGENEKAAKTFETLYEFCLGHDLFGAAVDAAHMVAITGTPEQQVEWAKKGIAAAEKGGLDGWLGPLWNNLGSTHLDAGRYEAALQAYRKARYYHWLGGDERSKLVADWAVGHTLRLLGRREEAGRWLRPVLAWAERRHAQKLDPETGEWVGLSLRELGYLARDEGRTDDARRDITRAKALLEKAGMESWDPKAWKELVAALAALEG